MSSSYSYKGVPLNQIYDSSGVSTVNNLYQGYIGFPVPKATTTYEYLRPNPFGYFGPNGDLRNFVDASNTGIITTSQPTLSIPQNCKAINVIAVGGGGGGGGAGGKAKADPANNGAEYAWGGSGGSGGYGKYDASNNIIIPENIKSISINIGNGGNGGASSLQEREFKSNYNALSGWNSPSGYANNGTDGAPGQQTTIKIGNVNYVSLGGNGGGYGKGAYGYAANSNAKVVNGDPGNFGNSVSTTYPVTNTTYPNLGNAGNPGNGGIDSDSPVNGQPGTSGAVQIIWLYD